MNEKKMLRYAIIGLLAANFMATFGICAVHVASPGLVPQSSVPLKSSERQVINSPLSPSSSVSSHLSSPSIVSPESFRSFNPAPISSLPPNHHQFSLNPIISPNQPHLPSGLTSKLRSKLPLIPFWSKKGSPPADKRTLSLVRFSNQYKRGLPNAMALYQAILESHERRWMLDSPEFRNLYPPGHPERMMEASNRKVGKVVNRIMSSFIGDCVGVVITEIFRKMGELAGEIARLIITNAAQHVLGREELSVRSAISPLSSLSSASSSPLSSILPAPGKTVSRLIQAIKPKEILAKKRT